MASTKLRQPPETKGKFLKPDQVPEVMLNSDSDESENGDSETVDDK
jgi:hypothetical protein